MKIRKYKISDVAYFRKTTEQFGGLSNMAAGYSVNVLGTIIPSSEHLYQACRFPDYPDIQEAIINEPNPMKAKWIGRKHIQCTRKDWDNEVKIKVMRWCLQIKLSQNWENFSKVLMQTNEKPIVEFTGRDKIWGAIQEGDYLIGINALGRLLMELREQFIKINAMPYCIEPPKIENFKLLSAEIDVICNSHYMTQLLGKVEAHQDRTVLF